MEASQLWFVAKVEPAKLNLGLPNDINMPEELRGTGGRTWGAEGAFKVPAPEHTLKFVVLLRNQRLRRNSNMKNLSNRLIT